MSQIRSLILKGFKKFRKKTSPDPLEIPFSLQKTFLSPHYQNHNIKRLSHLNALGLNFSEKKVIEFGAGVGDHTFYFLTQNAKILPTEARTDSVDFISRRFGIGAIRLDLENDLDKLSNLGHFDYAYCYGVLYHVQNPKEVIESISKIADVLLLETAVLPENSNYGPNIVDEPKESPTQAFSGAGCRPNRKWLYDTLKVYFAHVYMPTTVPNHNEFPKDWQKVCDESRNGVISQNIVRTVFVASKSKIENSSLSENFLIRFD